MPNFFKIFVAIGLMLHLQCAYADSLSSALQDVTSGVTVNSSDVSVYRNQSRTYVDGGGASIRFGTKSLQLISIQPPRLSAGCNGIDFHFGGFSFISGAEIQELVKMIMKNAVGLIIDLAIKVLCPACADAMQKIRDLAALARSMAADSCMAAKALLNTTMNSLGVSPNGMCKSVPWNNADTCDKHLNKDADAEKGKLSAMGAATGTFDGFIDSMKKQMSEGPGEGAKAIYAALGKIDQYIAEGSAAYDVAVGSGKPGSMAAGNIDQFEYRGNITDGLLLTKMGIDSYAQRMLLLSLTGTVTVQPGPTSGSGAEAGTSPIIQKKYKNLVKPDEAVCLLTWGLAGVPTQALGSGAPANSKCPKPQEIFLYKCISAPKAGNTSESWPVLTRRNNAIVEVGCMDMESLNLDDWLEEMAKIENKSSTGDPKFENILKYPSLAPEYIANYPVPRNVSGFYGIVRDALLIAVNKAAGLPGPVGSTAFDVRERNVINIISSISPIPIYRLVNISAVYPDIGLAMVDAYAQVLANAMAEGYLRHLMWTYKDTSISGPTSAEIGIQLTHLTDMLMAIDSSYSATSLHLKQQRDLYDTFNLKVDGLQTMVKRQVGLMGVGGATRFSQSVR